MENGAGTLAMGPLLPPIIEISAVNKGIQIEWEGDLTCTMGLTSEDTERPRLCGRGAVASLATSINLHTSSFRSHLWQRALEPATGIHWGRHTDLGSGVRSSKIRIHTFFLKLRHRVQAILAFLVCILALGLGKSVGGLVDLLALALERATFEDSVPPMRK